MAKEGRHVVFHKKKQENGLLNDSLKFEIEFFIAALKNCLVK